MQDLYRTLAIAASNASCRWRSRRRPVTAIATAIAMVMIATSAYAMPEGPILVCDTYPDAPDCIGRLPECSLCHTSPPARNAFGAAIAEVLAPDVPRPLDPNIFAAELAIALQTIETDDTDGDGVSNVDELLAGSLPGAAESTPDSGAGAPVCADIDPSDASWTYNVCDRDAVFTFAKVMRDVCGRSPTGDEIDAFTVTADPWQTIHDTLDDCLDSEYWLGANGVLWGLANRKIQPAATLKAGAVAGDIPLADYEDDYNLFVYTQIDDRDARELLTAQYMVARADSASDTGNPTTYEAYTRSPAEDFAERGFFAAQLLVPERRAGMITTRWFLVTNTMFTAIPRTSAAQAYRAYLGMDIAKLEGLMPVSGEPLDYDQKTVARSECAVCHSTLDPLTYPFSRYEGLGGIQDGALPGTYDTDRMLRFADGEQIAELANTPESGLVLGQPVADLLEWAQVAADSDAFARATVLDYWRLFIGDSPQDGDQDQFDALWQDFRNVHSYRIERMLHDLIETEAYSVP